MKKGQLAVTILQRYINCPVITVNITGCIYTNAQKLKTLLILTLTLSEKSQQGYGIIMKLDNHIGRHLCPIWIYNPEGPQTMSEKAGALLVSSTTQIVLLIYLISYLITYSFRKSFNLESSNPSQSLSHLTLPISKMTQLFKAK